MNGHPSDDELADLTAGLLDPGDTARVEAHVLTCDECRRLIITVEEVTATLRAAPTPPMPAHVAARLSRAVSTHVRARDVRVGRLAAVGRVAAGVAAVLVIGTGALAGLRGFTESSDLAAESGTASGEAFDLAPIPVLATGRDYRPAQLREQVQRLRVESQELAGVAATDGGEDPLPQRAAAAGPGTVARTAVVQECLAAIGRAGEQPVAADIARYEGRAATIIVLPAAAGSYEVHAVAEPCRPGVDSTMTVVTVGP